MSGHKFYAPKGVGALVVKIKLSSSTDYLRWWTSSVQSMEFIN
ncbi:MAG: aminotransferase class V-fold PLP-dependent enzyme [Nostochopsis sp.]